MANIKIVLDSRRAKADGSYNIIFRITQNNRIYTLNSGISVVEIFWNKQKLQVDKSHPNAKLLNLKLTKEYFRIQEFLLRLGDDFTIDKLRTLIDGKSLEKHDETFKSFSDKLILQLMQTNKIGNALVYQTATNRFIDFCGENIKFNQIDFNLIEQFTHRLSLDGLKQNSISNYLRTIRAIFNKAIKQKIVERSNYPFYEFTVKSESTLKRAISREDIVKLMKVEVEKNSPSEKALNYFLLSFYLIGMSFTDMAYLKRENIVNNRIVYRRKKTHKTYSVKLFPEVKKLLFSFRQETNGFLLPILTDNIPENSLKSKRMIQQWIKMTNKNLKKLAIIAEVNVTVTTYVARHTFATTAKKLGYSNELIAEALGHQFGNKTTNIYLDFFDKEVIDEMHQNVISL